MRSQNVTANISPKSRLNPRVFTEYGIITLTGVLKSKAADKAAVRLAEMFVEMRRQLNDRDEILKRLDELEKGQNKLIDKNKTLEDMQIIQFKELLTKMRLLTKHIFIEK